MCTVLHRVEVSSTLPRHFSPPVAACAFDQPSPLRMHRDILKQSIALCGALMCVWGRARHRAVSMRVRGSRSFLTRLASHSLRLRPC